MNTIWPAKDPNETVDYGLIWTPRDLKNDVIVSTTITKLTGTCTIEGHEVARVLPHPIGHSTVTWLSGGTEGETNTFLVRVVTELGRTMEQTVDIGIISK